jgi:hypothetical protein
LEVNVTTVKARSLPFGIAILALGSASPLHAQLEIGTWVRNPTPSMQSMTMKIEACCGSGGRRLTYHVLMGEKETVISVESRLDGTEAPVLMNGKPIGETMAIKRLDLHHANTVLKMNGTFFGTSKATLSADGKTLTVLNDYSSSAGGQQAGKFTEVWLKQ